VRRAGSWSLGTLAILAAFPNMREEKASFLWRLGKALHVHFDGIANEPLPQRWIDLINYLNEKERRKPEQQVPPYSSACSSSLTTEHR
jgi:hypothetical protein